MNTTRYFVAFSFSFESLAELRRQAYQNYFNPNELAPKFAAKPRSFTW